MYWEVISILAGVFLGLLVILLYLLFTEEVKIQLPIVEEAERPSLKDIAEALRRIVFEHHLGKRASSVLPVEFSSAASYVKIDKGLISDLKELYDVLDELLELVSSGKIVLLDLERLLRRGVKSLVLIEMDEEKGPIAVASTPPTEFSRRLLKDPILAAQIAILADKQRMAVLGDGTKLAMAKFIYENGERKRPGFIIAELLEFDESVWELIKKVAEEVERSGKKGFESAVKRIFI